MPCRFVQSLRNNLTYPNLLCSTDVSVSVPKSVLFINGIPPSFLKDILYIHPPAHVDDAYIPVIGTNEQIESYST